MAKRLFVLGATAAALLAAARGSLRGSSTGYGIVEQALDKSISVDFFQKPLDQAARAFDIVLGVPVRLDKEALGDAGVALDTPLDLRVKGIRFRSALNLLLEQLDLTWTIKDGAVLITTEEVAEQHLITRRYDVSDLTQYRDETGRMAHELDALPAVIVQAIAPCTWVRVGGLGRVDIQPIDHGIPLVGAQTPRVHRRIALLLAALRDVRHKPGLSGGRQAPGVPRQSIGRAPTPAEAAIEKALLQRPGLSFDKTPLDKVAAKLEKALQIPVMLHRSELTDVGVIPSETLVSFDFAELPTHAALDMMLWELHLAWTVRDEVLLITTPEEEQTILETAVYDVRDLVVSRDSNGREAPDYEALIDAVRSSVAPDSWEYVGGPASIAFFEADGIDALAVYQTRRVHRQLRSLLTGLRQLRGHKGGEIPFVTDGEEPSVQRVALEEILGKLVPFRFDKKPLDQVTAELKKTFNIDVRLDRRELEDVGVSTDVPVSCRVAGLPLRNALPLMLRPLDLTWIVQHESLLITTPERAENLLETRVYDVSALAFVGSQRAEADRQLRLFVCDNLCEMLTDVVEPDTWDVVGGPGSIEPVVADGIQALVIRQIRECHEELPPLLATLAAVRGQKLAANGTVRGVPLDPAIVPVDQTLRRRVSFRFDKHPLEDVAEALGRPLPIEIQVDRRELVDIGVSTKVPVTAEVTQVPLADALSTMLRPMTLDWTICDGVLLITTKECAECRLETRVYNVKGPLIARHPRATTDSAYATKLCNELCEKIADQVAPDTWMEAGGPGSAEIVPLAHTGLYALLIRQTPQVHQQIETALPGLIGR